MTAEAAAARAIELRRLADGGHEPPAGADRQARRAFADDAEDADVYRRQAYAMTLVSRVLERAGTALTLDQAPALRRADSIGPSSATPVDRDEAAAIERVIDQRDMRQFARQWELGQRTVQCHTTVHLGSGDAATVLPADADSQRVSAAHRRLGLVGMDWWPEVLGLAAALMAVLISTWRKRWPWQRSEAPEAVSGIGASPGPRMRGRELHVACWQLFALGRVVFESPEPGELSLVRSMVHPSGDIETSVRGRGVPDDVLDAHVAGITDWMEQLARGLRAVQADWLRWVGPLGAVLGFGVAGYAGLHDQLVLAVLSAVVGLSFAGARYLLRRVLRRRFLTILQDLEDDVRVPG